VAVLAKRATDAGIGIRNGIPEMSSFHLNEAPAYGSHVQPDGHLGHPTTCPRSFVAPVLRGDPVPSVASLHVPVVDETLPTHNGEYVVAMENECFTDCGFDAGDELEYAAPRPA